ncbi:MAG: hypothetical protein V3U24_03095 [Candidatus Neomarinimicrobiota bacterium]
MDSRFSELKKSIPFLLLWSIAVSQSYYHKEPDKYIGRQIITWQTIRNAGLMRLSDILFLAKDWNSYTIDGFTYYATANGLSTFQRQTWIVMLDGHRLDFNVFDTKNLNMLPVSLNQIDYVEIISIPQVHEGEFTEKGLLHFHTKKPKSGLSFRTHFAAGNETGDSGPYRYTEFVTPNIDKIGPDFSFTTAFGGKHFYAIANFPFLEHFATDPNIVQRNRGISAGQYPELEVMAPSLRVGFSHEKTNLELFAANSCSEDYLFFKPLGREIPVKNFFAHRAVRGSLTIGENSNVHYYLKYSINQLERRKNSLDLDFNWRLNNIYTNVEGNYTRSFYRAKLGAGIDRFWRNSGQAEDKNSIQTAKLYTQFNFPFFDNMHQSIGALAVFSEDEIAIKSLISNVWRINMNETLQSVLSFSQRLYQEDSSVWYWTENGYTFLPEIGVRYHSPDRIRKNNQATSDIIWKHRFNEGSSVETSGSFRVFHNLYVEQQEFHLNAEDNSFFSVLPIQILTGLTGKVFRGQITIDSNFIPSMANRLSYNYQTDFDSDDGFRSVWWTLPKHNFRYSVTYTPVEGFTVWAHFNYSSSSKWVDYQEIDAESNGKYSSTINGINTLDMAVQKQLWSKKLETTLIVRNILNKENKYHPIGASFNLSFHIQIRLLLDSV